MASTNVVLANVVLASAGLLDSTRISQMSLSSGKTKRTFPSLKPVLQTVVSLAPSRHGVGTNMSCELLTDSLYADTCIG